METMARNRRGITLIELVIVIAVISILGAIALTVLYRAKTSAYVSVMESDLRRLVLAEEAYYASANSYFGVPAGFRDEEVISFGAEGSSLDFAPSADVDIRVIADENAWTAQAVHLRRSPDRVVCAVFIGDITPFAPARVEGRIECRRGSEGG